MTDTYTVDSIFTIFLPVDGDDIESRFQVASRFLATPETNFYKQLSASTSGYFWPFWLFSVCLAMWPWPGHFQDFAKIFANT